MDLLWAFDEVAEGLLAWGAERLSAFSSSSLSSSPPPPAARGEKKLRVFKPDSNRTLFGVDGKPLTAEEASVASTWRSHHAFSARCAPFARNSGDGAEKGCGTPELTLSACRDWTVDFRVRSAEADPHVLLSVAPYYLPPTTTAFGVQDSVAAALPAQPTTAPLLPTSVEEKTHYDQRMLGTPLIWEEPYTLSLECTKAGLHVWSDHWQLFGRKIASVGLTAVGKETSSTTPPPQPTPSSPASAVPQYEGYVRLRWHRVGDAQTVANKESAHSGDKAVVSVSVGTLRSGDASSQCAGANAKEQTSLSGPPLEWQLVHETNVDLDGDGVARALFVPYVTLLEGGDEVSILHGE